MKLNKRLVIGALLGLTLGTIIYIVIHKTGGKIDEVYSNIFTPLTIGIFLTFISLDKKLKNSELVDKDNGLKFITKYKTIFLTIGVISLFVFLINFILLFQRKHYKDGWTDNIIKNEIQKTYNARYNGWKSYPEENSEFCDCAINKVADSINYKEFSDTLLQSTPDEIKKIKSIIKQCVDTFNKKIIKKTWTDALIKSTIELTYNQTNSATKLKYPKETYRFCECSINKIKDSLTYQEFSNSIMTKAKDDRIKSIIKECAENYRKDIEKIVK